MTNFLVIHEVLTTTYINDVDGYGVYIQQLFVYDREGDLILGIFTFGSHQSDMNVIVIAKAS